MRKIIIYHIILFRHRFCCWCFVPPSSSRLCLCMYILLAVLICFWFILSFVQYLWHTHTQNLQKSPIEKISNCLLNDQAAGETRYGKIMSSLNDTHSKNHGIGPYSLFRSLCHFLLLLVLLLVRSLLPQSKLQRVLFVHTNQLLVKQVYFAFKM